MTIEVEEKYLMRLLEYALDNANDISNAISYMRDKQNIKTEIYMKGIIYVKGIVLDLETGKKLIEENK